MNKLLDEFNINKSLVKDKADYDTFKDKDLLDDLRVKILENLSDNDLNNSFISSDLISSLIDEETYNTSLSLEERNHLFNLIDNEVNGYGPLTELLNDGSITEIMVNDPSSIFVEVNGKLSKDEHVSFINDEHIVRTIKRLIEPVGKVIDSNNPIVDAILPDGSRINAVIPPLSSHPTISIRKFNNNIETLDDLVGNGTLTPYMARFLSASVKAKLNILISGSSASGKTSLLNILSNYIPDDERIVTIEDVRELKLKQSNVVSLVTRNQSVSEEKEIATSDLVSNALRMRPDRIIIGEVRGREAFDLLQAMNTGHEGSISTIHASSPEDTITKLETMVLMDKVDIPLEALRNYINNALDLIVQTEITPDGKRKVTNISEVVDVKKGEMVLKPIFEFKISKIDDDNNIFGEFKLNRYKPKVLDKFKKMGIKDCDDIFKFSKIK